MLTEVWKDKNTQENMKEIKQHEIINKLHKGLNVVHKTDGEIYVSISIGEYIIAFTGFLHCAKKRSCCWKYRKWGCHLKNPYLQSIYAKVVENAGIIFSVSPHRTLLFSRKDNLTFFEVALQLFFAMTWLAKSWICEANSIEIQPVQYWLWNDHKNTQKKV